MSDTIKIELKGAGWNLGMLCMPTAFVMPHPVSVNKSKEYCENLLAPAKTEQVG